MSAFTKKALDEGVQVILELRAQRDRLLSAAKAVLDPTDCRYGPNGYCHVHIHVLKGLCPQQQLRFAIAAIETPKQPAAD